MRAIRQVVQFTALTALVLLLVAACGSSSSPAAPSTPSGGGGGGAANVTIAIAGFAFSPNPASVTAGQTVSWVNNDSVTHTATADNGAFNTGNIAPGATSAPITMTASGSIAYHCAVHPNMTATLQVQ